MNAKDGWISLLGIFVSIFVAGIGIWMSYPGERQQCIKDSVVTKILSDVKGLIELDPAVSSLFDSTAHEEQFVAYAVAADSPDEVVGDLLRQIQLQLCCKATLFVHQKVPIDDNPEEEQVGWKTTPRQSHILLSCSDEPKAVIIISRWRKHAKYWWLPGWFRTNVTNIQTTRSLFQANLGLLQEDSVGIIKKRDLHQMMAVLGLGSNQPAVTTEFISCNESNRANFIARFPNDIASGDHGDLIRHKVKKILFSAKLALDKLGVPFWLSSGTCLGFFRQCDVIPYTDDVDIGVFIEDYGEEIVPAMEEASFVLEHRFGLLNDSFQLAFKHTWFKLDIFFFYKEQDHFWNGGTQASTGHKFKYPFQPFKLCWTEFLGLLLRIPCHSTKFYVEDNYGKDWMTPVKEWDWKASASNVEDNGRWDFEKEDAIEFFQHG